MGCPRALRVDVPARIDLMIEERSLLKHPFYRMWSAGELDAGSLAGYSKEYFQLVKAVPGFMDPAIEWAPPHARAELESNKAEEAAHVEPWRMFAGSLGVPRSELDSYVGLEKTRRAVDALGSLMSGYTESAAAMYAFEKEIPAISQAKLDGLAEFYGISSPEATEYFRIHREADVRHAASWRGALESAGEGALSAASASLDAQHMLLDSCYEAYC